MGVRPFMESPMQCWSNNREPSPITPANRHELLHGALCKFDAAQPFFLFYPCGMMTFHQRRVSLDHRWSLGITGAEFLWIQWPFIEKERPWRCACPRKPTQRCALLGRCVSTVAAFTGCERSSYWVFCMDSDWWFGCHVLFSHEYWVYV